MVDFSLRPKPAAGKASADRKTSTRSTTTSPCGTITIHRSDLPPDHLGQRAGRRRSPSRLLPVAYSWRRWRGRKSLPLLLLLLVIPFWINELLRTFAWYIILAFNGPLNLVLVWLGLLDQPVRLLGSPAGVIVGMVYAYILFMVFPLYNAIESLDRNQIEAARDLGQRLAAHPPPHRHPPRQARNRGRLHHDLHARRRKLRRPGPAGRDPAAAGSPRSSTTGSSRAETGTRAAAYAFILLILCVGFILPMMRIFKVGLTDVAK